jgi:repressor LexA
VTVKRLKRRGREIVLQPENSAFEAIVVNPAHTDLAIEGIAVGLLRTGAFK